MNYTLEQKLAYATEKRDAAQKAVEAADAMHEAARALGGGIPGFGGSGNQRAAKIVRGSLERSYRAEIEANERLEFWDAKAKSYARRLAERDRTRLTREDVAGATHILVSRTWRKVVRVNATTVSVDSGYSWVDRIPFDQIIEARTIA